MVARDRLAYGSGISTEPAIAPAPAEAPADEPEAAGAPVAAPEAVRASGDRDAVLKRCWAAWYRAIGFGGEPAVEAAAHELEVAFGRYGELFCSESPGEDALALALDEVAGAAGRLIETVLAECGEEAAEQVRGLDRGQQ